MYQVYSSIFIRVDTQKKWKRNWLNPRKASLTIIAKKENELDDKPYLSSKGQIKLVHIPFVFLTFITQLKSN